MTVPKIRVFVSSPGDAQFERMRVERATERLNGEFAGVVQLETIRWERAFYTAHDTFQAQIPEAADCDIVVAILRHRLGSELPPNFPPMPNGEPYPSGTAYEVLTAMEAARQKGLPDLYVFRNPEPPSVRLDEAEAIAAVTEQWERLKHFFATWFVTPEGHFKAAFHEFRSADDFEAQLETLLRRWLEERILKRRAVVWPVAVKGSPFRGLAAFGARHSPVFFGRSRDTAKAVDALKEAAERGTPFVLVVGASGSGKSSLALAGIAPRLTAPGVVPAVDVWRLASMRPGEAAGGPLAALAARLFEQPSDLSEEDVGRAPALPELAAGDHATPHQLAALLAHADASSVRPVVSALDKVGEAERRSGGYERPVRADLLLVVDQLDELFGSDVAEEERACFARLLSALVSTRRVWVVATLRADLYEQFLKQPALFDLKARGAAYDLAAPGAAELAEIVRGPAAAADLVYEGEAASGERLDERLLADAGRSSDMLPLLQFTLDQLFKRRESGAGEARLTFAAYQELGGLSGAIDWQAERALVGLGEAERRALPRLLRQLVTTAQAGAVDGAGTALTIRDVSLLEASHDAASERLLRALVGARILLTAGTAARATVRLAHQRVLESWQQAKAIVAGNAEFYRVRRAVEEQHRRWSESGRRRDLLIPRGLPLAEAEDIAGRFGEELAPEIGAFIAASGRRARLTQRLAMAAAAVFAVVAVVAGWQWQEATTQRQFAESARQTAQQAEAQAVAERDRATAESRRADEALRQGLVQEADRIAAIAHRQIDEGRPALAAALALQVAPREADAADRPLTHSVAAALARSVRIDRELERHVPDGNNVMRVAATADGRTIVTGLNTGAIQFWDLSDAGLVMRRNVKALEAEVTHIDISPDQQSVLVAGDKVPSVWDLRNGEKRFDLAVPNPGYFIKMARYSPDGKVIATGGAGNRALLFDAGNGKLLREIAGPAFQPAYERARARGEAAGGGSGFGDPIVAAVAEATFRIFGAMTEIAFSPDSRMLAAIGPADPEAAVRLYDVASGTLRSTTVGPSFRAMGGAMRYGEMLNFSQTGRVASIVEDHIFIIRASDGVLERALSVWNSGSFLITQDGRVIVSAHRDGSILLWCAASGHFNMLRAHRASVEYLGFNAAETLFVSTANDGTVAVWPMPTTESICGSWQGRSPQLERVSAMRPIFMLDGHTSIVHRAVFTDNDRQLLTVSRDGSLRSWHLLERGVAMFAGPPTERGTGMRDGLSAPRLEFAGEGRLLIAGTESEPFHLWDLTARRRLGEPDADPPSRNLREDRLAPRRRDGLVSAHATPFEAVVFDPADGRIVSRMPERKTENRPYPPYDPEWSLSPDGERAAGSSGWLTYFREFSGGGGSVNLNDEGPPVLMNNRTGERIATLAIDSSVARLTQFSADGRVLVASMVNDEERFNPDGERFFAVWDAESGRPIGRGPPVKHNFRFAMSDDGRTIIAFEVGGQSPSLLFTVKVDEPGKDELAVHELRTGLTMDATVSADGRLVAIAHQDGSVRIWNAADRSVVDRLFPSERRIERLALSRDGSLVAVADLSGTIGIIDRRSNTVIASPTLVAPVVEMRFSSAGRRLAALVEGGRAYVVDTDPFPDLAGDGLALVDWVRASRLESVSASDSRYYRLTSPPLVERPDLAAIGPIQIAPSLKRAETPQELAACDALAASPYDRDRLVAGVLAAQVDVERALAVCAAALEIAPDDPATLYHNGRLHAIVGRMHDAIPFFRSAAERGYAAAIRAVGFAILEGRTGALKPLGDPYEWFARAARAGDPIALLIMATRHVEPSGEPAQIENALALALAAGSRRLSMAAMQIGQTMDNWSRGRAEYLKQAFFFYQLGLWIADNVVQAEAHGEETDLRRHVAVRAAYLARMLSPYDVVAIYRNARDWRPRQSSPAAP